MTPRFTPREQEVRELLERGLQPRAIAAQLGVSERVVWTYIQHIHHKLAAVQHQRVREVGDER